MARLYTCGFELRSVTANVEMPSVGGTIAISTTTVRSGTASLQCNAAAGTAFAKYTSHVADQSTVAYARVYLNITSTLPAAGSPVTVLRFQTAANGGAASISITSTGALRLTTANGTQIGSDSTPLTVGVWYRVELKLDASSSPGSVEGRIDGVAFASGANNAQTPWNQCTVGVVLSGTANYFIDDWAFNDSSGSSQNSWCGPGNVAYLLPASAGSANAWLNTTAVAGTTSNYTLVDEVTPNTTTDFVQAHVLNAEDYYALTLAGSGIQPYDTVNVVHVGMHFRSQTAGSLGAFQMQLKKSSAGTVATSSTITPASTTWKTNAAASPFAYPLTTYADPDGTPWTTSTLATTQVGEKLTVAATTTTRIQITTVWVVVEYVPGITPPSIIYNKQALRRAANW